MDAFLPIVDPAKVDMHESSEDEQVSPRQKNDDTAVAEKKDKKKQSLPEGFQSRSEYKAYLGAKKAYKEDRPFEARKHKGAVEKAMKDVKKEMTKMQTHLTSEGKKNTEQLTNEGKKNTEQLTSEGKMNTAFLAEHSKALHGALATTMEEKFQELKADSEIRDTFYVDLGFISELLYF